MTVIKDDNNNSDGPPPPYAAIPSISSVPSNDSSQDPQRINGSPSALAQPYGFPVVHAGPGLPHSPFGPTPISSQQQSTLLPYYDPRSPYAMQQAVSRARWRFFYSLLWAVAIWCLVGLITGGIVVDVRRAG